MFKTIPLNNQLQKVWYVVKSIMDAHSYLILGFCELLPYDPPQMLRRQ